MKYTKKDLGSFNLHLIHTDKLKTTTIRVVFHTPIKKEEITRRNILSQILILSSEKYNSRRNMTIKAEELYAASLSTDTLRFGNYIITSFNLKVLNDSYTEKGNLEKSIEFLSDIIYHPDIENNAFKSDKLDIVKYDMVVNLNSLKEDAGSYSLMRMAEAYDKDSPISYRMTGYLEDLEKTNEQNLYESYAKMIDNDYVDICVVGQYDNKEMLTLIKKYFKFKKVKKEKANYFLEPKKPRKRRLFAKETIENAQSKLAIACQINKLTPYERDYSLTLANVILGSGTDSKLFKEVREKNSLCYSIHSMAMKADNLLIIRAGIDKNNFLKTVAIITEKLNDMKKGHFTDEDIQIAKEIYNTAMDELEESDNRMIGEVLSEEVLGLDPLEERIKKMNKVRKQDIVKVCKKINMDTVFLLEGVKHERD